jgi:peptidoglycan/LPS O-acetylase OafA/YrhL
MSRIYAQPVKGQAGVGDAVRPCLSSSPMDVLIHLFVALHIIGIAALLGGFLTQLKAMGQGTARFVPGMLHGALTMLVTGVVLVGLNQADDHHVNNLKIGIKLALLVVILGLVYVKRDDEKVDKGLFGLVGLLTTANIFIAVLWT